MCRLVEHKDGHHLNDVGSQETIPYPFFSIEGKQPQHGNNRQRQGKGNEECHVVMVVEFIDNHDGVDVAEGDETDGEDAQGTASFGNHIALVGTKEHHDALGPYPYVNAGDGHRYGNEIERLAQHQRESLVVALPHLDGAQRLDSAADASQKQVVYQQQVHTEGKGIDTGTPQG